MHDTDYAQTGSYTLQMGAKPTATGSIGGIVFRDADANKFRGEREAGLASWRVYIDRDHDGKRDTNETSVLTNTAGRFVFKGLAAGTYDIRIETKSGLKLTSPTTGLFKATVAAKQALKHADFGRQLAQGSSTFAAGGGRGNHRPAPFPVPPPPTLVDKCYIHNIRRVPCPCLRGHAPASV